MLVHADDHLPEGTIVFAQYKQEFKGTAFKKVSSKYFLNSVTVIMKIDTKYINIKVSNKGKLQITGCNQNVYATQILKHFWKHLSSLPADTWHFQPDTPADTFEALIIPVMCNINFSIPFQINRESLNHVINTQTRFISILEPSDGYVGVNIKIAMQDELLEDILIDRYTYPLAQGVWCHSKSRFMDYMETLTPKEQKKKIAKCYINTFLVFYSGKVIMSGGISHHNRKRAYEQFMKIIYLHQDAIQACSATPACSAPTPYNPDDTIRGTLRDRTLLDKLEC